MAITFYRAFFQVGRVMSQPAVKLLKRIHMLNPPINAYGDFLIGFGRYWYRFERILSNNKMSKLQLTREAALNKGIDNFYNIVFYCLFFMFPVGQIVGIWLQDKRNARQRTTKLESIQNQIKDLQDIAKRVSTGLDHNLEQILAKLK